MANITFGADSFTTSGELPAVGRQLPQFALTSTALEAVDSKQFDGKKLVISLFPSIDTPTCAASVRQFHQEVAAMEDTVVLCISADLPFAQARFWQAETVNQDKVVPLSTLHHPDFGKSFGVAINEKPLAGLLARAVITCDAEGMVRHVELVENLPDEPNYQAALASLN